MSALMYWKINCPIDKSTRSKMVRGAGVVFLNGPRNLLVKTISNRYYPGCKFPGGVAEWFKAAVLKTAVGVTLP
jgi:hypothetical protein